MKTHRQTYVLPGALLVLAGIAMNGPAGCHRSESGDTDPRPTEAVLVTVAEVRTQTLRETVRGIGTLRAAETVEVKPEIDGIVRGIHFEEGGSVARGQLLVALDDNKLRHELAAGQATLEAARVRRADAERLFKRMQELVARHAANQDELDETETAYLAAQAEVARMEAQVELLQARLADARLQAPFDGVISERHVDVGDYVQAGTHLATLYRVSQMEISFTLPERFMGRVQPEQTVAVQVAAYPERNFAGRIYFVSPEVAEATRDFLVKATVENPEGLLKPGAFGTAVVTLEVHEQRAVVPEEALVATRAGYIVFVVENQTARRREVQIGLRATGVAEIRAGVQPGERVVRAGQMKLSDGAPVRVAEPSDE